MSKLTPIYRLTLLMKIEGGSFQSSATTLYTRRWDRASELSLGVRCVSSALRSLDKSSRTSVMKLSTTLIFYDITFPM